MIKQYYSDIILFGGGIAGLWALNHLEQLGYSCILLESESLGNKQTINSQGIIHSGFKYALDGNISNASKAVSNQSSVWRDCLKGVGYIDLRSTRILSDHYYLWSNRSLFSKFKNLIGSKFLQSNSRKLTQGKSLPQIFQHPNFKGEIIEIDEIVIDVSSLIQSLAKPKMKKIIKFDTDRIKFEFLQDDTLKAVHIQNPSFNNSYMLNANYFVFTAGEGNEFYKSYFPHMPSMQKRPLHMLLFEIDRTMEIFGHCIGMNINPLFTITTHRNTQGKLFWYIGGKVAEDGVNLTSQQLKEEALALLKRHLNWVDLKPVNWYSFIINRAEGKQPGIKRPDSTTIYQHKNIITAWPTKLTLAPKLAEEISNIIKSIPIQHSPCSEHDEIESLPKPTFAKPVWESL